MEPSIALVVAFFGVAILELILVRLVNALPQRHRARLRIVAIGGAAVLFSLTTLIYLLLTLTLHENLDDEVWLFIGITVFSSLSTVFFGVLFAREFRKARIGPDDVVRKGPHSIEDE